MYSWFVDPGRMTLVLLAGRNFFQKKLVVFFSYQPNLIITFELLVPG